MGREIRRVDLDWEHPRYTDRDAPSPRLVGHYRPLYDSDYDTAARKWIDEFDQWRRDEHSAQKAAHALEDQYYWDYAGAPPDPDYYRAEPFKNPIGYQVYETVSEGTPVSPIFATPEELIEYLVANGDYWDQRRGDGGWQRASAERFVNSGFAVSMIVTRSAAGVTIAGPGQQ